MQIVYQYIIALDPLVPHVAAHWFVLMWCWVFHTARQQVIEHCQYLWTLHTTPRLGNMMDNPSWDKLNMNRQ